MGRRRRSKSALLNPSVNGSHGDSGKLRAVEPAAQRLEPLRVAHRGRVFPLERERLLFQDRPSEPEVPARRRGVRREAECDDRPPRDAPEHRGGHHGQDETTDGQELVRHRQLLGEGEQPDVHRKHQDDVQVLELVQVPAELRARRPARRTPRARRSRPPPEAPRCAAAPNAARPRWPRSPRRT